MRKHRLSAEKETGMSKRFLGGEFLDSEPTRSWYEQDGVIYFSVTSDGTTGEEWITRLESKGFRLHDYPKRLIRSFYHVPTKATVIEVAVLKGMLFRRTLFKNELVTRRIHAKVKARLVGCSRNLCKPSIDLACLIREKFTDEEIVAMKLSSIVVMSEPISITSFGASLSLLAVDTLDSGRRISVCSGAPSAKWEPDQGFAFAIS